jgi:hypothetical protein
MRYACLIYYDEGDLNALPGADLDSIADQAHAYGDELRERGHLIAAGALEPVQTATTLRERNGRVSMTDGPFSVTKEQLGGFFLIDARDLNEAIQVASKLPQARLGSIEVRPVRALQAPGP